MALRDMFKVHSYVEPVETVYVIPRATEKTDYPSGLVVETEHGWYFIQKGQRFQIPTQRVLDSWGFSQISPSSEAAVKHIKVVGKLGFRDGTVIEDMADTKNYLISGSKRRHITDPDAFDKYGLDRNCVIEVSHAEANLHDDGEELN